jgi:TonB family protein
MKTMLLLCLCAGLLPAADARAQTPRDTPPPAIENARRERELRATIASGAATKETYLELAGLMNRRGDFAKTIEALEKAAELEPDNGEGYHRVATFYWEKANKDYSLSAAEKRDYVLKGLAMEDKALALNPKYLEAMTYKNILLRLQANTTSDQIERARLLAEADALRNRVLEMQRQEQGDKQQGSEPPPPPFQGFAEPFEQTFTRVQPIRVGGDVRVPTKVRDVKPVYPADAQAAGVQGVVIIEALIDESGSVANARVLRSIPSLDQAALGAVSQWRFTPTNMNGRPSGILMTVTVNFMLQ